MGGTLSILLFFYLNKIHILIIKISKSRVEAQTQTLLLGIMSFTNMSLSLYHRQMKLCNRKTKLLIKTTQKVSVIGDERR